MLKWLKSHWKLLTAIGLALLTAAVLAALFVFVPPVAAAITTFLVANAPAIGAAIAATSPVAGAFIVGGLAAAATLIGSAFINFVVSVTNLLDRKINSAEKKGKEGDLLILDEDNDPNDKKNGNDNQNGNPFSPLHENPGPAQENPDEEKPAEASLLVEIDGKEITEAAPAPDNIGEQSDVLRESETHDSLNSGPK